MVPFKRFTLAAMMLILAAPIALAGPNWGGVLVVHATTLAFTSDTPTYVGLSGVACGQDGPAFPAVQQCPPYDPIGGVTPCVPNAANPTSTMPADVPHVWYVMAAFADNACPRIKSLGFQIEYDATKVQIVGQGVAVPDDAVAVKLPVPSTEDGAAFPANRSGMAVSFSNPRTSQLQEVWWFAGYSYADAVDATFALKVLPGGGNDSFVDDTVPAVLDPITAFGVLGLGGTSGENPQAINPVETTSWGRLKATYGPK